MPIALISVSDKTGVVEFAQGLEKLGWKILSTGGTFRALQEGGGKNLQEVADFTGFPEGLDGRIKTLTPQIFGGLLRLRNNPDHEKFCNENNLEDIDLVCVNLYPFKATYENPDKTFEDKVENIDIGGPSMIRAAAKNYEYCSPVVDPADYATILQQLESGGLTSEFKKSLATKTFEMTAHYDLMIARFWAENTKTTPETGQLRYGENPHQAAVLLDDPFADGPRLAGAEMLNGKPLSYNNFGDATGALELALSFAGKNDPAFACVIKHATPCGAAIGDNISQAFEKAYGADKVSAFGGIIALNRTCDKATAEQIVSFFNEIVMAPAFDDDALEVLKTKQNLRVLRIPNFTEGQTRDFVMKKVRGGTLVQDLDTELPDFSALEIPTKSKPSETQMLDLELAWKLVKIVKSNAIVVVKNGIMHGKGGGQTSRVDAMKIALEHAGENAHGGVIGSDAFFPFPDAIEIAGEYDISAIVQPGGSRNDDAVMAKCDELNISTVLTGMRGFLH